MPEVARAMVVGYPSQNPYSIDGKSQYAVQEMRKQDLLKSQEYRDMVPRKKKEPSVGARIEDIIMEEEVAEKRRRAAEEKRRVREGKVEEV